VIASMIVLVVIMWAICWWATFRLLNRFCCHRITSHFFMAALGPIALLSMLTEPASQWKDYRGNQP
jgi:hypothetical protein